MKTIGGLQLPFIHLKVKDTQLIIIVVNHVLLLLLGVIIVQTLERFNVDVDLDQANAVALKDAAHLKVEEHLALLVLEVDKDTSFM
jgi:hypothetical protein